MNTFKARGGHILFDLTGVAGYVCLLFPLFYDDRLDLPNGIQLVKVKEEMRYAFERGAHTFTPVPCFPEDWRNAYPEKDNEGHKKLLEFIARVYAGENPALAGEGLLGEYGFKKECCADAWRWFGE